MYKVNAIIAVQNLKSYSMNLMKWRTSSLATRRKCKYCGKWYDTSTDHNCIISQEKKKVNNRIKQRQYYEDNKDTAAYKAIHSKKWRDFRKKVIIADHGMCQRCLIKFGRLNSYNLEVHHIAPRALAPELAFEEDNVVTLCKTCNLELGLNGIDFDWSPDNRKVVKDIVL